jgi:hypothetical protein
MSDQVVEVARQAIAEARSEGLGEEDVLHTAVEACVRYGREQGSIGDVLACETLTALRGLILSQLQQTSVHKDDRQR